MKIDGIKLLSVSICVHLWFLSGCASDKHPTTRPADAYDRQDAALHDPFGYSPMKDDMNISGGKLNEYDKNAMKRDIDHVLNP